MNEGKATSSEKVNFGSPNSISATTFSEFSPPPVLDINAPLALYWQRPVSELATVNAVTSLPELASEAVRERHRIYALLLMGMLAHFWNGNKFGPVGHYPHRENQKLPGQSPNSKAFHYSGYVKADVGKGSGPEPRKYIGHNVACIAVDQYGKIIDFDFHHHDFPRSLIEHAEARLVRRLFGCAGDINDWKARLDTSEQTRSPCLEKITIYTSLQSCPQCSGLMSLGRVKQVVYLQMDPGAHAVGHILHNLSGPNGSSFPMSPIPIAASMVDLPYFSQLNAGYTAFHKSMVEAKYRGDSTGSFFIPSSGADPDYNPAITSFLCTDTALSIFNAGRDEFQQMKLAYPGERFPGLASSLTNAQCMAEAQAFSDYACLGRFRGSPNKL